MASEFLANFDADTIKKSIPTMRINSQNMTIDKIIDIRSFGPQHAVIAECIIKKLARFLFPSRVDKNKSTIFFGGVRVDFEYFIESHWLFCFVLSKIWNNIPVYCKKTSLYFSMPLISGLNSAKEVFKSVLSSKSAKFAYFSLQTVQYVEQIAILKNSNFFFPRATQMTYKGCSKRFLKDKKRLLWSPKNRLVFEKDETYMKNLYFSLLLLGLFADEVLTSFGSGIDLQVFMGRIKSSFLRTKHGHGVDLIVRPLKADFFLVGNFGTYRPVSRLCVHLSFSSNLLDTLFHARCLSSPLLLWNEAVRAVGAVGHSNFPGSSLRLCSLQKKAVLTFHGHDLIVGDDVCIKSWIASCVPVAPYVVSGRRFVATIDFFKENIEHILGAKILKRRIVENFMNCMQCILYVKSCLGMRVPGIFWMGLSESKQRRFLCVNTKSGIM